MRSLDDILEGAKRLKREELSRLVGKLDEHLSATADEKHAQEKDPYARTYRFPGRPARRRLTFPLTRGSTLPMLTLRDVAREARLRRHQ